MLNSTEVKVISLRIVEEGTHPYQARRLANSGEAFELFKDLLRDLDREAFWVACLDPKNKIASISQVSVGTLTSTQVHPREVFKVALLANANAIITAHNHPSGDPNPSLEDMLSTDRLQRSGELLGVKLHDHIIIGRDTYYSFADEGKL